MTELILPTGLKHTQDWADTNRLKKLKMKWTTRWEHHKEQCNWNNEQGLEKIAATHAGAAAALQQCLEEM